MTRARARRGAASAVVLALLGARAASQTEPSGAWRAEGSLENDAFLPTSKPAEDALARGDRALELARKARADGGAALAERQATEAFEAWHEALAGSGAGDSVWFAPEPAGEKRLSEGVEAAVARRLRALAPEERDAWRARFDALARADLAAAHGAPALLAGVARVHPGTLAGLAAATRLGDLAFEEGREEAARRLWERARATAEWIGAAAREPLARLAQRPAGRAAVPTDEEPWARASGIRATGAVALSDPAARLAAFRVPEPSAGVRPGLAFLSETSVAVQTLSSLFLVRLDEADRPRIELPIPTSDLLPNVPLDRDPRLGRRAPGWPLLPAARDGDLALVVGLGAEPNELVVVRPSTASEGLPGPRFPRLVFGIAGGVRFLEGGASEPIAELAELDDLVFQPGPVLTEDLVLVQARKGSGDLAAWLLAFDRRSGELRWKRFLASGAEVQPDVGRIGAGRYPPLSAAPLCAVGGLVFAGTHLGAGALLDQVDGQVLWTFKVARRSPTEPGWDGGAPRPSTRPEEPVLLWAPSDSDQLYVLRALPAGAGEGPSPVLACPPRPLGEASTFDGGEAERIVVHRTRGAARVVSELDARDARADSVELGPSETFPGRALVCRTRVLVSSDRRLSLLDRTRDLRVIDDAPLASPDEHALTSGGDVYARGARVLVLARDALFAFRTR